MEMIAGIHCILTIQIKPIMRNFFIGSLAIAVFALACGGDRNKKMGAVEAVSAVRDYSAKVADQTKTSTSKWQERKAKGDTLAMAYTDLQTFLPDISGYNKNGGPTGSQMSMAGMGSWSQTEQEYQNGDKRLKVAIMDYNSAYQIFVGATTMFKMGYSMEDDSKKQGSVDLGLKDVTAFQTIYKKDPRGELALIVGDRFLIQIESQGSNDPQLLSSVAGGMKLSELASK
jgi:hypothetical protein